MVYYHFQCPNRTSNTRRYSYRNEERTSCQWLLVKLEKGPLRKIRGDRESAEIESQSIM